MGQSPGLNVTVPLYSPLCVGRISNLYNSFLFGNIIILSDPLTRLELDDIYNNKVIIKILFIENINNIVVKNKYIIANFLI